MEACSKWMYPGWILSVLCTFVKVYMFFFRTVFFLFCFYRHFWPLFGALFGPFWPIKELFGTEMGSFWGDFGPFLGQSGVILSHLGFIVASFWHHFGVVLVSFWLRYWEVFSGPFCPPPFLFFWTIFSHFEPFFCPFFGAFTVIFAGYSFVIFRWFWCKFKPNDASESEICNFLPKSTKTVQICAKTYAFFFRL